MLRWVTVLGIAGFLSGFIGPMVLAPDANQGPMLGIFITGPGGLLLGAILGGLVGVLKVPQPIAARLLAGVATVGTVVTLYFCVPAPSFRAEVIDGEIRLCVPVESMRDKTVERLNRITAGRPPLRNPIQWADSFNRALAENKGVVIAVHVVRRSKLYENRALWNRGTLVARPWTGVDAETKYFTGYLGNDCAAYAIGTRSLLAVTGNVAIWPPAYIGEMLELKVAAPPSAAFAAALAKAASAAPN